MVRLRVWGLLSVAVAALTVATVIASTIWLSQSQAAVAAAWLSAVGTMAAAIAALYLGAMSLAHSDVRRMEQRRVASAVLFQPIFLVIRELEQFEELWPHQMKNAEHEGRALPSDAAVATAVLESILRYKPIDAIHSGAAHLAALDDRVVTCVLLFEANLRQIEVVMFSDSKPQDVASAPDRLKTLKASAIMAAHYLWREQFPNIEQPWRGRYVDPDQGNLDK